MTINIDILMTSLNSTAVCPLGKIVGGRLDLSDKKLRDLKQLGVQPALEVLIVSNNRLKSFASLQPQPNLTTIIASNNPIDVLNGLPEQPALQKLDLSGTPVSHRESFRCLALATVGENLTVLNGERLTRQEQDIAKILAKRTPEKLFLGEPAPSSVAGGDDNEDLSTIHEVYVKEHQQFFAPLAYNEAVLFDLQQHGPLPFIDETSTEDDIARAIQNVRRRVEGLRAKIESLGGET